MECFHVFCSNLQYLYSLYTYCCLRLDSYIILYYIVEIVIKIGVQLLFQVGGGGWVGSGLGSVVVG